MDRDVTNTILYRTREIAKLQVVDAPVILANGQRFTMFLYVIHTIGTQIDYGITDIVAAIILLRLLATSR